MAGLTLDQQASLTAGATMWSSHAIDEVHIPALHMADGPMGVAGSRVDERDVSTLTPAPVALGASWDVDLVRRIGALVGGDARERGVQLMLAPNLNLARSPLAGRAFEYFSEDPLLTGLLGAAWIEGVQSRGVGAVAKHLVCNDSETARDTVDAVIDEKTLREIYLLPFELAAEAGCAGMLTAYNKVNGVTCSEAGAIITDIVKGEWSFGGLIMSDWFGTHSTDNCLAGGLDLEMPGPARYLGPKARDAVLDGRIPAARIADAAERVAATARRFGHAADPGVSEEAAPLLRAAAAAGFTLLRNEGGILPVSPGSVRRIAVIGPNATAPCFQGGTFAKIALRLDALSPLDAILARFGEHCEIVSMPGVDPQPRLPSLPASPSRDLGDGYTTGLTVDYFEGQTAEAEPVFSETRDTNSLTWFFGVHDAGAFQQPAMTRASGVFTPAHNGVHTLAIGGTGAVRLLVDGAEVFARDEIVAASDVMGRLKSGEADMVEVTMTRGVPVRLAFELRYAPARVQGLWYGIRAPGTADEMLAAAVDAAAAADIVFLIVGETSDASVESKDREGTSLPVEQIGLIDAVTAANPKTVIVANVGHAFDTSWDERAAALLLSWYPGEQFGPALAAVLAGDLEPGGRMPMTIASRDADYPAFSLTPGPDGRLPYTEGTGIGYRGLRARGIVARHPFGSGFGYARFVIADPRWEPVGAEEERLSVLVRNISDRPGAEVVQVYRDGPEWALAGFSKVHLQPGQEERVGVVIRQEALRRWVNGWQRPGDDTVLRIGRSSDDLPLLLGRDARGG